jgi:hypothetical protein
MSSTADTYEKLQEDARRAEEKAAKARRAFERAVTDGKGVFAAWLDYRTAAQRRYWFATEARQIADRLGTGQSIPLPSPVSEDFAEAIKQVVARVSTHIVEDELDEMREAREKFAEGS